MGKQAELRKINAAKALKKQKRSDNLRRLAFILAPLMLSGGVKTAQVMHDSSHRQSIINEFDAANDAKGDNPDSVNDSDFVRTWQFEEYSTKDKENNYTEKFALRDAMHEFFTESYNVSGARGVGNLQDTVRDDGLVYSHLMQLDTEGLELSNAFKQVFLDAFERDPASANLPFNRKFIEEELFKNTRNFFIPTADGGRVAGDNVVISSNKDCEEGFADEAIHEIGHVFGLGEPLTALLTEEYVEVPRNDREIYIAYSAIYDRQLMNIVGEEKFWQTAFTSNQAYGKMWDENISIVSFNELQTARAIFEAIVGGAGEKFIEHLPMMTTFLNHVGDQDLMKVLESIGPNFEKAMQGDKKAEAAVRKFFDASMVAAEVGDIEPQVAVIDQRLDRDFYNATINRLESAFQAYLTRDEVNNNKLGNTASLTTLIAGLFAFIASELRAKKKKLSAVQQSTPKNKNSNKGKSSK
jgi:hypothetical protein